MAELGAVMAVIVMAALTLGAPLGWAVLLNLRDRRQARLLQTVLDRLGGRDLRGRVAVQVRCGVLRPRSVVRVHLLSASRSEIWELLARLSERLSCRIRLEVTGPVEHPLMATFTLEPALSGAAR